MGEGRLLTTALGAGGAGPGWGLLKRRCQAAGGCRRRETLRALSTPHPVRIRRACRLLGCDAWSWGQVGRGGQWEGLVSGITGDRWDPRTQDKSFAVTRGRKAGYLYLYISHVTKTNRQRPASVWDPRRSLTVLLKWCSPERGRPRARTRPHPTHAPQI